LLNSHKCVKYPELSSQMIFTYSKAGVSIPAHASWCQQSRKDSFRLEVFSVLCRHCGSPDNVSAC